jgi:hypothetical protein
MGAYAPELKNYYSKIISFCLLLGAYLPECLEITSVFKGYILDIFGCIYSGLYSWYHSARCFQYSKVRNPLLASLPSLGFVVGIYPTLHLAISPSAYPLYKIDQSQPHL